MGLRLLALRLAVVRVGRRADFATYGLMRCQDYVELDVRFKLDLYPFYPPLVKLLRPRFKGFLMGRVTSMSILQLRHWNPGTP